MTNPDELPEWVHVEIRRVLDRAARRLLDEEIEREARAAKVVKPRAPTKGAPSPEVTNPVQTDLSNESP